MTTSETPIEPEAPSTMEPPAQSPDEAAADEDRLGDGEGERGDAPVARGDAPVARSHAAPVARPPRTWRWWARVVAHAFVAFQLVLGWVYIAWMHRFHVTVSTVVMSLGWAAVVLTAYLLVRIGLAAAFDDPDQEAWWRPVGKRDELEREKRSLLKAIKELEFDREMGKMTDADAAEIVRVYRAHAIEVIKALDHLESGGPKDIRDEIERELRARQAVAGKPAKRKKDAPLEGVKTRSAGVAGKAKAAKESAP
jgi:hypothetical protein